jgi:two-component system, sensor histidine kinase PdtaS
MKKIHFLLITFLLWHQWACSQQHMQRKIDSLLNQLQKTTNDTVRVNLYSAILSEHLNHNPKHGLTYEKEALALAQKLGWQPGIALLKHHIGRLYWRTGKFDEARKHHFDALNIYVRERNKTGEQKILTSIGQDYLDEGKYDEARSYLLRALEIAENANDKINIANVYDILIYMDFQQGNFVEAANKSLIFLKINEEIGNQAGIAHAAQMLGINFSNVGNFEEALKYFKQGLQAVKQTDEKIEQAYFNAAIGDVYVQMGSFAEGVEYLSIALRNADDVKDIIVLSNIHERMGNLHRLQGKPLEAIKHYQIAADGLKSVSDKKALATVYSGMGMTYIQLREYDKAKKCLDETLALSKGLNSIVPIVDYYIGREKLDSATGNWKDAYTNYKRYIFLRDSTFNIGNLKKIVSSQMQYDNDKKAAVEKAEQEKKDIQVQEELRRHRNIRNYTFAVLSIVLLFSVVFYLQRNKIAREKKKSDKLLTDKELLLKEIHHRVKNNLEVVSSLLALQSAQIDDPYTKDAMQEGQNRVHSIGMVHQKLYQGENLDAIDMKDYFVNLSKSILHSFGAEERITIELAMDNLNVDIDTAVPLGLIVNELLTNTIKYAFPNNQSGTVNIKLEKQTGGILHLEVSDNGVGKSGLTQGSGFGGQLVSLLTKQLNGSMKEENKNGTHISFDFKPEEAA